MPVDYSGRKKKNAGNMDRVQQGKGKGSVVPPPPPPMAKIAWSDVGNVADVAGSTLGAFGSALDTSDKQTAVAPAVDNTTLYVLGGVLVLGVVVFAMSKK